MPLLIILGAVGIDALDGELGWLSITGIAAAGAYEGIEDGTSSATQAAADAVPSAAAIATLIGAFVVGYLLLVKK
jgi:hypothetical protein